MNSKPNKMDVQQFFTVTDVAVNGVADVSVEIRNSKEPNLEGTKELILTVMNENKDVAHMVKVCADTIDFYMAK